MNFTDSGSLSLMSIFFKKLSSSQKNGKSANFPLFFIVFIDFMGLLFKNATVVNEGLLQVLDVYVEGERIVKIGQISAGLNDDVIDADYEEVDEDKKASGQ